MANEISKVTRRNICDTLVVEEISWWGRLEEVEFLKRAFPDLAERVARDGSSRNVWGEIWQHRVNFSDWSDGWIFDDSRFAMMKCPDSVFCSFLCETAHPIVREKEDEARSLVDMYNGYLGFDGWEIFKVSEISGQPVFAARRVVDAVAGHLLRAQQVADKLTSTHVSAQINRIERALEADDSELAIGTAKDFLESLCKAIHEKMGVTIPNAIELPRLLKSTRKQLELLPDDIDNEERGADVIKKLLSNLGGVASGMGEIRNLYGTGHGRAPSSNKKSSLELRHAKLATGAAITLAVFFYDTYEARHKKKKTKA
jgi:AbiJ N-terminal domain 3/Abortive infection C-terminus